MQGSYTIRFRRGVQESHNRIMRLSHAVTGRRFASRADDEVVRVRKKIADERTQTTPLWMHSNSFDRRPASVRVR